MEPKSLLVILYGKKCFLGHLSFSCRFFPPRIRVIRRTSDQLIYIYIYIYICILSNIGQGDLGDKSLEFFFDGPCHAVGHPTDKPTPLPYEAVHLGNQVAHHSHKLQIFRGLVYCRRCGMRGPTKLDNLAHPCKPPTAHGKGVLASLSEGRLPPRLNQWPGGP